MGEKEKIISKIFDEIRRLSKDSLIGVATNKEKTTTIDDIFEVYNQITDATGWEPMLTDEQIAADIARNMDIFNEPAYDPDWKEKINAQTLQPDKVLMSREDWDLLVEWDSHLDNTLTVVENPPDPHCIIKNPEWEKPPTPKAGETYYDLNRCCWWVFQDGEWLAIKDKDRYSYPNTLTVEDVHQVYYEVMNQGFQVQPIYINIDEDEEDMNDWLDEYFLTYAPQSVCNTSKEDDCQSECKKECENKKECCIKCTCTIKDLMAYGCRCGAAKKEKEDK